MLPEPHRGTESMRVLAIVPVIALLLFAAGLFEYADTHPLPANGYGRSILFSDEVHTLAPGESASLAIGGETLIPAGSHVTIIVNAATPDPGDDFLLASIYVRLTNDGVILAEGTGSGLGLQSFDTRVDTDGDRNPEVFVRNDHAFPVDVWFYADVLAPPTTLQRFTLLSPLLILTTAAAAIAAAVLWIRAPGARNVA